MLQYNCPFAVQYLPHIVHCNTFHSACNTTVHLLCSNFHIMFTVTHSIQPALLSTCCTVLPHNIHGNTFHLKLQYYCPPAVQYLQNNDDSTTLLSTCKTTFQLLCSTFHILFTVTHSRQPAITLSTCCEVPPTQCSL